MIEHVMLFKLADPAAREALAARMAGALPGARVGLPADRDAEVWDLLVVVTAPDAAALRDALAAPAWTALQAEVAGAVQVRKGWTFALRSGAAAAT
ncbi:MAG: hypothetical protein R3F59_04070 [Myxococcota bacterium]